MRSSKRVVRNLLAGAVAAAMGVTTLFANAGSSYAAGEVALNKTSRNILTRQSYDFDVTGAPSDAVITWKSSDETVATVDENGVVTGVTKGTATITCEVTSAGKTQKLTAEVSIRKPALKIEINNKVSELKYGEKVDLNRTLTPKTSNDVTTWKSSNTSIATVDANGVVKGLKDGTVTITATTMSGKSDSVEITVYGAPAPTKAPEATATPVPTKAPQATPTPKPGQSGGNVVYEESFEKSVGSFTPRGSVKLDLAKSATSPDGTQYLQISGRTSNWNGAAVNMNKLLELGGTYKLSAWVRQTAGSGEVIKATLQKNDNNYSQIQTVTTEKNAWTEIAGEFKVDADTTDLLLYFEADTLIDFQLDKVVITKISGGSGLISAPVVTNPGQNITFKFADLKPNGYGYTATNTSDGGVKVEFNGQYQEIWYALPQDVDLAKYDKVIFTLATKSAAEADALALKVVATDAELDEWNNPTPFEIRWGATTSGKGDLELSLSSYADKDVCRIGIMTNTGATTATIYSVTFVPKK
ncbi:MAG: carbohydrate binding domain-containing protein [Lachnospiraceae bacterium]|nr:carbohydrate binding domain-containing protein [Lachnospiraceae bacterium]